MLEMPIVPPSLPPSPSLPLPPPIPQVFVLLSLPLLILEISLKMLRMVGLFRLSVLRVPLSMLL